MNFRKGTRYALYAAMEMARSADGKPVTAAQVAERYGIPAKLPIEYPLKNYDLANRVAIVAQQEGWCPEYVRTTYQLWFREGLPAGDEPNLSESLKKAGQLPDRVLELADSDAINDAYQGATSRARTLGIFGSPSFVVDGLELFWGDDRLEEAIDCSRRLATPN